MSDAARDRDLREGLDAFQGDMAEHQKVTGREVTGGTNQKMAAELFEELDKNGTFDRNAAPAAPEPVEEKHHGFLDDAWAAQVREKRQVNGREYETFRGPDVDGPKVRMSRQQRELEVKALKRIKMLLELQDEGILGAPSFRQKALAIFSIADLKKRAMKIDEMLDESNKYFGDWQVDPDRKIIITG